MSSVAQDDLRNASQALRTTLRFEAAKFAAACDLSPRRYSSWERGLTDLNEAELAGIRLAILGLAQQQKCVADKCLNFALRHQDAVLPRYDATGEASKTNGSRCAELAKEIQ